MSAETHRVLMGACGWKHQAWTENYYSDDLPEDWQLGFYSNDFPLVYVPASDWLNIEDLAEWTEDVSESFRFVLGLSSDVLDDETRFLAAVDKVKLLGDLCLGLVFQLNPNICNDKELLEQRLKIVQSITSVCVDTNENALSDEFNTLLSKYKVSEVWKGKSDDEERFQRGSLSVSVISGDEFDMAGLRKVVEHCLSVSNEGCTSVLCLDGNPPSLELLRNADIILNLL